MPCLHGKDTQYSLSDNPALLGKPNDFAITVSSVNLSNGAGFSCLPDRVHYDNARSF